MCIYFRFVYGFMVMKPAGVTGRALARCALNIDILDRCVHNGRRWRFVYCSQKYFETVGEVDIEPELHIDVVDRNWNRLIMSHQERDQLIHEEIKRWVRAKVREEEERKKTRITILFTD